MTNNIKLKLAALGILFLSAFGQTYAQSKSGKAAFFIETDPSTFALGGYAAHIRFKPANSEHLLLGLGTYSLDFPEVMINMNGKNKDKGWDLRIKNAYSFFGEYYFSEAGKKWYTGLQLGVQNFRLKNEAVIEDQANFQNLIVMPSLGYSWTPFKFPLYLKPWLGLGYTTKLSGENVLQEQTYDIAPLVPFFTLHVGYRL
ncbi:MAG: hypothetical protein R3A50_11165 [Saprospiraceae bacterium]